MVRTCGKKKLGKVERSSQGAFKPFRPLFNEIGKYDGPDTALGNRLMLVTRGFIRSLQEHSICGEEFKRKSFGLGFCDRKLVLTKTGTMGFANGFDVACTSRNNEHSKPTLWTSARIGGREQYIINMSVAVNTMLEGNGFEGMNRLFSGMGLGSVTKSSYLTVRDKVYLALNELAEESRRKEAQFAVKHFGIDLRVVFDGSWGKRMGDNSTTALVQCITPETNKIIGTCVVSKVCTMWKFHATKNAKVVTQDHECPKNWEGPSAGMQQYGIECIVKKLLFEEDIRVSEIVQMDGNFARSLCHLTWKNRVTDPMSKAEAVNFVANLATCIWNKGHQVALMDLFDRVFLDFPMERLALAIEDDTKRFLPVHLQAVKRREEARKALKLISDRLETAVIPPPLPVPKRKWTKRFPSNTAQESDGGAEHGLGSPLSSARKRGRPRKSDASALSGDEAVNGDDNDGADEGSDPEDVGCLSRPEHIKEGIAGRIRNRPRVNYSQTPPKPIVSIPKIAKVATPKTVKKPAQQSGRAEEAQFQAEMRREMAALGERRSAESLGRRSSAREKRMLDRSVGRPASSGPVKKKRPAVLKRSEPPTSSSSLLDHVGLVARDGESSGIFFDGVMDAPAEMDIQESANAGDTSSNALSERSFVDLNSDDHVESTSTCTVFARTPDGVMLPLAGQIKSVPRGRGRPPKLFRNDAPVVASVADPNAVKRPRGRPSLKASVADSLITESSVTDSDSVPEESTNDVLDFAVAVDSTQNGQDQTPTVDARMSQMAVINTATISEEPIEGETADDALPAESGAVAISRSPQPI